MLANIRKKTLLAMMLCTFAFSISISIVKAEINPAKKYQYQGQIIAVDQARRLLTIETTSLKGEKNRPTLTTNTGIYEVTAGIKLKNVPKSERYSGLKFLQPGVPLYFNVKHGTEKNKIPTITEAWIELQ